MTPADHIPSHAIVRPPGASFARAISSRNAPIDVPLAQTQHAEYCQALAAAGLMLEKLPADERFPDSCFVQDPAVVIGGRAIIGRPAAASRRGEEEALAGSLTGRFPMTRIGPPGTLEGGDVLLLPGRVLVGCSGRTNRAGIAQLARVVAPLSPQPWGAWGAGHAAGVPSGLPVTAIPVHDYLHLLTAVTYIGHDTLLAVEEYAGHPAFAGIDVLIVPREEAYAANALGVGDRVILPAGYPRVAAMLRGRGFEVLPVPTSEFAKADGGVTCLSLVW